MMLIDSKSNPRAAWEFSAEITPYESKDKCIMLWENYEPNVISMTTKQCCTLVPNNEEFEEMTRDDLTIIRKARKGSDSINPIDVKEDVLEKELGNIPGMKRTRSRSQDDHMLAQLAKFKAKAAKQSQKKHELAPKNDDNKKPLESIEESKPKVTFDEKLEEKKTPSKEFEELGIKKKKSLRHLKLEVMKPKVIRLKFKYQPAFVTPGQRIFISDSTMKATGIIKEVFFDSK